MIKVIAAIMAITACSASWAESLQEASQRVCTAKLAEIFGSAPDQIRSRALTRASGESRMTLGTKSIVCTVGYNIDGEVVVLKFLVSEDMS